MLELSSLKRMVETSADLTQEAREASERDRDYYDGFQWTPEEVATLQRRKQPVITINRIKRKVDAMVGIEQRGRTDPRAMPRNPGDEEAADLATKALVFVEEIERVDVKRSGAFENLIVEGYGGVEVCAEPRRGQMEPCVKRLRWEEIFFDPHSREKDFSDAAFVGVLKWMTIDAARSFAAGFWQGSQDELDDMLDADAPGGAETHDDRPTQSGFAWADKRQRRVRVAQMYYKRGDAWHLAIFTGKGELYNDVSPYVNEDGKPDCAIILMSGYVDRENRRYGVVRDMISPQDEINKRRSKILHGLNSRQTMGLKGAVDVAKLKRELAAPDGHVEIDGSVAEDGQKLFDIIPTSDQTMGQFQLLQEAKAEIDMTGPNASLLGQLSGQQSGRAIMAQQQAGLAELAPIYDSLRDWTERVYRAIWARIRQFWTEPRWIRVTEENEAAKFIGINQVAYDQFGQPQMMNRVAEIDVDIIIEQAPEYATLRAEQFDKLTELAGTGFPIPPQVIIEASDLRDKRKLLEAMQHQENPAQATVALKEAQATVALKEAQAKRAEAAAMKDVASIPKAQAEAAKTQAEAMGAQQDTAARGAAMRMGLF